MPFDGLSTEKSEVAEVLFRMREALSKPGGWCQGALHSHYGGDCLVAAAWRHGGELEDVVVKHLADNVPLRPAFKWLRFCQHPQSDRRIVVSFNDGARTQDEVVALIDRAIASV